MKKNSWHSFENVWNMTLHATSSCMISTLNQKEPYTCIIDSDTMNAEQVLSAALEHLEAYS